MSNSQLSISNNISGSLDEPNSAKLVYLKSTKNKHIFAIEKNQVNISALLESLDLTNNDANNPIVLDTVIINNENNKNIEYEINTYEMLNYIYEYMNLWKDDIKDIFYIKEEQVQLHDPALILVEKDYLFIKKYIDENISAILNKEKPYDNFNINEYNEKKNYYIMITIQILGGLICQAEYLQIQCLANKLYAWCACLVWNTSLIDMYEATNDPYFIELQNKALEEYYTLNKDKKDFYEQLLDEQFNYEKKLDVTSEEESE